MILDLTILFSAAVMAVVGYLNGALRQLVKLAALIFAFIGAKYASVLLVPTFTDLLGGSYGLAKMAALAVCWLVIYLALIGVGYIFIALIWDASEKAASTDRALGAGVGLLKSLIIFYFIVCFLLVASGAYPRINEALGLDSSFTAAIVKKNNILTKVSLPTPDGFDQMFNGLQSIASLGIPAMKHGRLEEGAEGSSGDEEKIEVKGHEGLLDKEGKVKIIGSGRFAAGMRKPVAAIMREEEVKKSDPKKGGEGLTGDWSRDFGMNRQTKEALNNPAIQDMLSSENVMKAISGGDFMSILGSKEFGKVMQDPQAMKMLMQIGAHRYGGQGAPAQPAPPK